MRMTSRVVPRLSVARVLTLTFDSSAVWSASRTYDHLMWTDGEMGGLSRERHDQLAARNSVGAVSRSKAALRASQSIDLRARERRKRGLTEEEEM